MFAGLCFSIFLGGEGCRRAIAVGAGPTACNCGGRGISFKFTPAALASSCCMTWAYMSSRSRCSISRSASTTRLSTYGSPFPGGDLGCLKIPRSLTVVGNTYGFGSFLSGEGQEKFRGPPGTAPGDTGDGSVWYA